MRKTLINTIMLCLSLSATAQTTVSGTVEAKAGIDNADPWAASLNLDIKSKHLTVKPFFSLTGIGKNASGMLEDLYYTYPKTGNIYTSHSLIQQKGLEYNYGVAAQYQLSSRDELSVNLKGKYRDTDLTGTRTETMDYADASLLPTRVRSSISAPGMVGSSINASASYKRSLAAPDSYIKFDYDFTTTNDEQDRTTQLEENINYTRMSGLSLASDTEMKQHTVSAEWSPKSWWKNGVGRSIVVAGAKYLHRQYDQHIMQTNDIVGEKAEEFHHRMQSGDIYADYKLIGNHLVVNAHVGYEYTRMGDKNLHDFIPRLNATWRWYKNSLSLIYNTAIIRPNAEQLSPIHIFDTFSEKFGNATLEGMHVRNIALNYTHATEKLTFKTTLTHIFVNDGYNLIWMTNNDNPMAPPHPDVNPDIRIMTILNTGVRRAWSLTPDVEWRPSKQTTLGGSVNVIWDKRVAEAINMSKEHWGFTASGFLRQRLPWTIDLNLNASYSEGNTLDLYSHSGRMLTYGGSLERSFLKNNALTATLSFQHLESPKVILTQFAYIGSMYLRDQHHNTASLALKYKF